MASMTAEEKVDLMEFTIKNRNKNMFLGKMAGKIQRKGVDSLTEKEVAAIQKRMKEGARVNRERDDYETLR